MEGIEQEIKQESGQNTDRYYAVIDTETTGLGTKTAQILQFGIIIFTSDGSERYKVLYTNRFNFGYNVPLTPYVRDNIKLYEYQRQFARFGDVSGEELENFFGGYYERIHTLFGYRHRAFDIPIMQNNLLNNPDGRAKLDKLLGKVRIVDVFADLINKYFKTLIQISQPNIKQYSVYAYFYPKDSTKLYKLLESIAETHKNSQDLSGVGQHDAVYDCAQLMLIITGLIREKMWFL